MMRISGFCFAFAFLAVQAASAQTALNTVVRDPQAVALIQKAIAAMGAVPTDSLATGTIQVVEGATPQSGTIQILTLGSSATSETISLPSDERIVVYSNWDAKETRGSQAVNPPLETILTDQCADFPLPLLSSLAANTDEAMRYVGQESVNGVPAQHIQIWNTFASRPRILQKLAAYSKRDIWFDATSGLPLKIAFERRAGGGAVPAIPVEIYFSGYKSVQGAVYPMQIKKSYDGTPWQTISIDNVTFNNGLTADQFQTE